MISRRDFLGTTAGLTSAGWLHAQDAERPVFWVKLSVTVSERLVWRDVLTFSSQTRYISGLEPGDFRVLEDGILQKITTFAEGAKPPLLVSDDGSARPLVDPKASEAGARPYNPTTAPGSTSTSHGCLRSHAQGSGQLLHHYLFSRLLEPQRRLPQDQHRDRARRSQELESAMQSGLSAGRFPTSPFTG